ncbi:hypothetical protein FH972_025166 [Carpinus fangiana]|uniref:Uncharacterized protein n=1 Tax=Carpinus fangiana TaxID=176857 RepID=A0A5N6L078_9ROSI|nr:hypothetical protein FH972_025166 [Carpinus fangiana]
MADLQPPPVEPEDSGVTDLGTSKTLLVLQEHITDRISESSDDHFSDASEGASQDPRHTVVPTTRVERVDDEPAHGETPGTAAYDQRTADAVPDELEVIPEGSKSRTESIDSNPSEEAVVPTTIIDKVEPNVPSHGEIPDTPAYDLRKADAEPDVVRQAPEVATNQELQDDKVGEEAVADDDFDDFAEGDDDDFGAFDEAEQDDGAEEEPKPTGRDETLILVAPPPLQPPDWVRSRIRRLFLVSLGVPVDLDEILPASKQKKLVLPSIDLDSSRRSTEGGSLSRLKQGGKNASSSSVGSVPSKAERRRRGPPPPPEFQVNTARLLCSTTDVALSGFADAELREHAARLEGLKQAAVQTLEYWLIQKDSAAGDKEAFEEVIENLVKHAKKIRK